MDLTLEEQKLLADFRRLSPEGQQELLALAVALGRTQRDLSDGPDARAGQCRLEPPPEVRPETTKEPVFTE